MKVKVCGITNYNNALQILESKPDYLGFIFFGKSQRYIGESLAASEVIQLSKNTKTVGVFVNEKVEIVKSICTNYQLDYVQLHGDESPEYCANLKQAGIQIFNAFRVGNTFDFDKLLPYHHVVDYFLFDTLGKTRGGTGQKFNWDILNAYTLSTPFILSGGITHEDAETISKLKHSKLHSVDINSQFEIEPGLKNVDLVNSFIQNIRHEI